MLQNYLLIAARHLAKNKVFTGINVFCLALGMSLTLVFIALLSFVFTYDNFHANKDRIYRVITQVHDRVDNPVYATAPTSILSGLREGVSGIERVVPVQSGLSAEAMYEGKALWVYGYFADPEFLQTFSFPLIKGNAALALSRPNTLVISESLADKLFGSKEPMGEIVIIDPWGPVEITGIMKDVPKNSHMQFEVLASSATVSAQAGAAQWEKDEQWKNFSSSYIYLLLPEREDAALIEAHLNELAKEGLGLHEEYPVSFELQPLHKIVPGPEMLNGIGPRWDYTGLFLIGLLTLIILIPACFNYINLSIAQSLNRMKEVGVRKVMGGSRKQLFFQFVTETTLMMLLASVLSYFIFEIIREEAIRIMEAASVLDLTPTFVTFLYFILFTLFVGFAAGSIPALYFSKMSPVNALKAKPPKSGKGSLPLQKVVIATQFVLSIGFIMGVVVVIQQYRYSVKYDFGFAQENILTVDLQGVDQQLFRNEYGKLAAVERISMSSHLLGLGSPYAATLTAAEGKDSIGASYVAIDENFITALQLTLLAGKNFEENAAINRGSIIVNEAFVKELGLSENHQAIGRSVILSDGSPLVIRGVVADFHYSNLRDPIKSFFFTYDPELFTYASLQLSARDGGNELAGMEAIWKSIDGSNAFGSQYYSDQISEAYTYYVQIMKLWGFLGLLAITVACLGLLGTVVFTVKNRLKEVSIRKVLGASTESLVFLLSKDYIKLMGFASLIAIPATYLLLDQLVLTIQHYSMTIGFIEILLSLMIVVVLGLTTILSQTLKAAHANPVDSLKSE